MGAWLGWSNPEAGHPLPTHTYFLLAFSASLEEGKGSETHTSAATLLCQKVALQTKTQTIIKKKIILHDRWHYSKYKTQHFFLKG